MRAKTKLSTTESKVLDMLPRGAERPIQARELMKLTGLSNRGLYIVINGLITKAGVPIVSIRTGEPEQRGFYIATNEEDRSTGLVSITQQTQDMTRRIKAVREADLYGWQQNIIRPINRINPQEDVG